MAATSIGHTSDQSRKASRLNYNDNNITFCQRTLIFHFLAQAKSKIINNNNSKSTKDQQQYRHFYIDIMHGTYTSHHPSSKLKKKERKKNSTQTRTIKKHF